MMVSACLVRARRSAPGVWRTLPSIAWGLLWLLMATSAASQSVTPLSVRPVAIRLETAPVALDPANPLRDRLGHFQYAGGIVVRSQETDRLHGLSDLVLRDADRLLAIGDDGTFVEARLQRDAAGRLVGLRDARISLLPGETGRPLADKADADAEGLAVLPDGDRLISFERRHRIWRYPADGGNPVPVASPDGGFPANGGMEALALDPDSGGDVYLVGHEVSGETWTCRLSAPTCAKASTIDKPLEYGLVALRRLPGDLTVALLRAYDPFRGNRTILQIARGANVLDTLTLAAPLTVDNFEGVDAVPGVAGGWRFYLLSDDNGSARQRTLLLAFDWQPVPPNSNTR